MIEQLTSGIWPTTSPSFTTYAFCLHFLKFNLIFVYMKDGEVVGPILLVNYSTMIVVLCNTLEDLKLILPYTVIDCCCSLNQVS